MFSITRLAVKVKFFYSPPRKERKKERNEKKLLPCVDRYKDREKVKRRK